jgi:hypothetical protein
MKLFACFSLINESKRSVKKYDESIHVRWSIWLTIDNKNNSIRQSSSISFRFEIHSFSSTRLANNDAHVDSVFESSLAFVEFVLIVSSIVSLIVFSIVFFFVHVETIFFVSSLVSFYALVELICLLFRLCFLLTRLLHLIFFLLISSNLIYSNFQWSSVSSSQLQISFMQ